MNTLARHAHLHLVSVATALFIALWFRPASQVLTHFQTISVHTWVSIGLGLSVFLLIISIWWWYALILTQVASSNLTNFIIDFVTLLVCGVGFDFWFTDKKIFIFAFFVGSFLIATRFLIAIRFCDASGQPVNGSLKEALKGGYRSSAFITVLLAVGIAIAIFWHDDLTDHPYLLEAAVAALSLYALAVTGYESCRLSKQL